jgi:predicted nucleotidyltransferase
LAAYVLTEPERRFLKELETRGVRYMIVGLTAASLQGANTTTVDVDLWFETIADPRIQEAAIAAGGHWVSGFGMMPAQLGGPLGDRFDVVIHMSGLERFDDEYARSLPVLVEGVQVRVLPLERILVSKRAANRPKDTAVIPALEEALAAVKGSVD